MLMGELLKIEEAMRDPALLGYPPTLPIEVALKTAPLHVLKVEYGFEDEEWAALRYDPNFIADLARAMQVVRQEGMSFKLKARLQAEEILKTSWRLIHDATTPASVRSDLIKSTMRWAGYDNKENIAPGGGSSFAIQINLGG